MEQKDELGETQSSNDSICRLVPSDILKFTSEFLDNKALYALSCTGKFFWDTNKDTLRKRLVSIYHAHEAALILREMRQILRHIWNPIRLPALPEDEYDFYLGDFMFEAMTNDSVPSLKAYVANKEIKLWGVMMTNPGHHEWVAAKIYNLRIPQRTSFTDPLVFRELGKMAFLLKVLEMYIERFLIVAVVLEPNVRTKNDLLAFRRRMRGEYDPQTLFMGVWLGDVQKLLA